jgi:hypothetical protein
MRLIVAIVVIVLPGAVSAQDLRQEPSRVGATIDRALGFLTKDALAWKNKHHCASCHHAALVIWAMREAKQRGHAVDGPVLTELTKWVAESGDGKFGLTRPASAPKAASPKAVYFALALGADPKPDAISRTGMKLLLKTVQGEQTDNGSWSTWPETRPPIFGNSDETLTALAILAVLPAPSDRGVDPWRISLVKGKKTTQGDQHRISRRPTLQAGSKWRKPTTISEISISAARTLLSWTTK